MFTPRPRSVRDYLNDASIKALSCANETRTGMRGDPAGAGGARVCSAVLAEVRDAFDLRAPWLKDRAQLVYVLGAAEIALKGAPLRLDVPVDELAQVIGELIEEYEEEAQTLAEGLGAPPAGGGMVSGGVLVEEKDEEDEDGNAGAGAQ